MNVVDGGTQSQASLASITIVSERGKDLALERFREGNFYFSHLVEWN